MGELPESLPDGAAAIAAAAAAAASSTKRERRGEETAGQKPGSPASPPGVGTHLDLQRGV